LSRFLLLTSLCGWQREVSAAPHRGNANRPISIQGKAQERDQGKAQERDQEKSKDPDQEKSKAASKHPNKRRAGKKKQLNQA
jgi:hypothetical protein